MIRATLVATLAMVLAAFAPRVGIAADPPLGAHSATLVRALEPRGSRGADPDTTVDEFLKTLADSTDAFFGASGAPLDTAGLDSARLFALEHPRYDRSGSSLRPRFWPDFAFNRVDGPVWRGGVSIGREPRFGRFALGLGWAAGPNDLLGTLSYSKAVVRGPTRWTVRASGGRETENIDRSRHAETKLATLRALIAGGDRNHYLRRKGGDIEIARSRETLRLAVGYRDELETPLTTTATWNLLDRPLKVVGNTQAARGRAHEFTLDGSVRVPGSPVIAEAVHNSSSRAVDSDFEYRRTWLAAAADVGLARWFSLVPQVGYGRLSGEPVPQAAFYLGGAHTLRTVKGGSLGGTGMAIGRLDLIAVPDLLALAHLPHPDAFPIQGGLFAASGAVWGTDPYGGPTRPGVDWPHQQEWQSEAGISLIYQPGIPDPTSFLRVSYGFALGPRHDETHVSITFTRALDLVRAPSADR